MSLARASARGAAVTMAGQAVRFGLQLVSVLILARLLTPADYGVVGMVAALIGFAEIIRDFGLSSGAIQRLDLSRAQQSTLFYLNCAIGLVIGLAFLGLAVPIGAFYDNDQVPAVAMALAVVPAAGGVTAQFLVDLMRSLRFAVLATAEVIATAAGVGVGIALASAGAGLWALVALQLTQALSRLLIMMTRSGFRPGRPGPLRDVLPVIRFGRNLGVVRMLDNASRTFDNILIGRAWGATELGLYSRAYQLLMLPLQQVNTPIGRVAFPVLVRLQAQPERFAAYLRTATVGLGYGGAVVISVAVVYAEPIVRLALGDQWDGTVDIFRALAVAGVLQSIGGVNQWIFMALDRTHIHLRYALIAKPMIVAAVLIGLPWKGVGVAVAYSVATAISVPLGAWMACRGTFLSARAIYLNAARPFMLAGAATAVLLALQAFVGSDLLRAVLSVVTVAVLLVGASRIRGYRSDAALVCHLIPLLRGNGGSEKHMAGTAC